MQALKRVCDYFHLVAERMKRRVQ